MTLGRINKLETFGSVDGPGIRFVVFTQGCPMRCKFCHNPETWDFGDKSANGTPNGSFEISAEDLLKKAIRYKPYWGTDGGITVSGGEPLAQIDFMIEFFEAAKAAGVHTCVDTCGITFRRTGAHRIWRPISWKEPIISRCIRRICMRVSAIWYCLV